MLKSPIYKTINLSIDNFNDEYNIFIKLSNNVETLIDLHLWQFG